MEFVKSSAPMRSRDRFGQSPPPRPRGCLPSPSERWNITTQRLTFLSANTPSWRVMPFRLSWTPPGHGHGPNKTSALAEHSRRRRPASEHSVGTSSRQNGEKIHMFPRFRRHVAYSGPPSERTLCVVGDVNSDGVPEIVIGARYPRGELYWLGLNSQGRQKCTLTCPPICLTIAGDPHLNSLAETSHLEPALRLPRRTCHCERSEAIRPRDGRLPWPSALAMTRQVGLPIDASPFLRSALTRRTH
jgi:hypothetical protein